MCVRGAHNFLAFNLCKQLLADYFGCLLVGDEGIVGLFAGTMAWWGSNLLAQILPRQQWPRNKTRETTSGTLLR